MEDSIVANSPATLNPRNYVDNDIISRRDTDQLFVFSTSLYIRYEDVV